MIYLLQGPDEVSSRAFLLKLKEKYQEVTLLNPKKTSKLKEILPATTSFFSKNLLVVIENFLPQEEKITLPAGIDLLLWTKETLTPPAWVDKNLVFKLSESASTFKLADAVGMGEEKLSVLTLEKLFAQNIPSEIILGSLVRQVRLLTLGLEGSYSKISPSSFVQSKVRDQVKFWDFKKLRLSTRLLLKTDWEIKTGQISKELSLTALVLNICQIAKAH